MTYNINVGPFYIGFPVFLPIKVFATMNNVNIIRKNNLTNKCGPADSPRHVLYTMGASNFGPMIDNNS